MSIYIRPRQKTGSIAIPFMITILISLFVIGGVALHFYNKLTNKTKELKPMQSATTSISDADINSILFILDPTEDGKDTAVMVFHFDPVRKQEYCIGIPLTMEVTHEGKAMSVEFCYVNHGANALKNAIGRALDQEIARYIQMDDAGFDQLIGIFGNLEYAPPIRDTGLQKSASAIMLDSQQFETMLTSMKYDVETARCTTIGLSVSQLLNQCDGQRISSNIDHYFNSFINVVQTDITAMDFSNHRHAISYVFEFAQAPAHGVSIICEQSGELLQPTDDFIKTLKVTFNQTAGEGMGTENPNGGATDQTDSDVPSEQSSIQTEAVTDSGLGSDLTSTTSTAVS